MQLDFTSNEQLALSDDAHWRDLDDGMIRAGLVLASDIVSGDVVFMPNCTNLTKHIGAKPNSLNCYGRYQEVLHTLTGLRIVKTTGVVAVANTAKFVPLAELVETDGSPKSDTLGWNIKSGKSLSEGRLNPTRIWTDERVRTGLVEVSEVLKGGEVAVLPSIQVLRELVRPGFATTYNNDINFHQTLETVLGLTLHPAGYLGLTESATMTPAHELLGLEGQRLKNPAASAA